MRTRVVTSVILLLILIPLLLIKNDITLALVVGLIAGVASFEWLKCINGRFKPELWIPLILFSVVTPTCALISIKVTMITAAFLLFYVMALQVVTYKRLDLGEGSKALMGVFYIALGFISFLLLRLENYTIFWLIFISAWGCDVFAYFGGRLFGKHKLLPEISPKKTIEGSIIGSLAAGVFFVVFNCLFLHSTNVKSYFLMFALGIAMALASQLGDLIMSAVKRQHNIKDFGHLLPGHGGVLDRFDSVLFVAPILYCMSGLFSS